MSILYKKHLRYPESILIRDFTEKVRIDDIIESWEYLTVNGMIDQKILGVINNTTGCELEMDIQSFRILVDYLKKKDSLKRIKLAVICDNPKTIVFPMLGEYEEKELKIRPFSTLEAATDWIVNG